MNKSTIILGTGIIGLACAIRLARTQMSVLVLDKDPALRSTEKVTARVSALSGASIQLLQKNEVWQLIPKKFLCFYDQMHLFDHEQSTKLHFNAHEVGREYLGAIVDNAALRFALYQVLQNFKNVDFVFDVQASRIEHHPETVRLYSDQGTHDASLLIGADGAQSWVREQMGLQCATKIYDHHALVATVVTEKPHANTAWQSFLKSGPLAFLPLADPHTCAIVWSTSPAEAERLKLLSEESFCTELGEAFSHQLGAIQKTSIRMVIPLVKRHAESYGHNRIALCGDAAHSIHPMAGQGMNLGFQDAECLTNLMIDRYAENRDIGSESLLKQYQRRRYYHNQMMLTAMDFFDWIFTTPNVCLQSLRKMGLGVVSQSKILQRFFVNTANSGTF